MIELCFNCMNRSAYFLGDEDPDLPGQVVAASEAGFRLIGPDAFSLRDLDRRGSSVEALARQIEAAGLRCFELPTWTVSEDAAQTRRDAEELLAMARILRPEFVQLNVVSPVDASMIDEMRRAAAAFASSGTKLAVEYLPWLPEIRSLEATRAMMRRLDVEGAGIILDTWHFFFSEDTWEELAALPLEEIAYVQFDDHPVVEGDDLVAETVGRRVMPGEGVFELDRFCEEVRAKGFDGVVSCEILSEETRHMDLGEFARRVHSSCARFWC